MSSSTPTLILASLLVVGAITLGLTRNQDDTKPDRPKTPIPTLTRSKLPNRHATIAQLLSSKSEGQDRKSWAKSLSDKDLKRLTLEMIDAYQSDEDHSKTTPWLTALAMEWGRRDFDEMMLECELRVLNKQFTSYSPNFSEIPTLTESLRCAAAAGLAEDDPSAAWSRFNDDNLPANSRTNADFISPVITPTKARLLAAEAIFRSWARIDAASAWKELLSFDDRDTTKLAPAIRGLLAETKSADLRNEIVDWVNQTFLEIIFQGIPPTPGYDVTNIIGSSRHGDGAITRNSINAILNNPNRTHQDPYAMQGAIALGLAEKDPSKIGKLTEPTAVDFKQFIPMHRYLTEWVDRHPTEAIAFQSENLLTVRDRTSIATGLFNHDPRAALDTFRGINDPQTRLEVFNGWIHSSTWFGRSEPWPLIEGMQAYVPVASALQSLEQNIARLGLGPQSEQTAVEALKNLATLSDPFSTGGFEFPSEDE